MFSLTLPGGLFTGIYPERREPRMEWFDRVTATAAGFLAPWLRPRASRFEWIVDRVHLQGRSVEPLTNDAIREAAQSLRQRLRSEGFKREWVAQAFALVREAASRTLGLRHFDVQLVGGLVLLKGMVAEMETGEGKTLTATLPACTAALAGIPVHIITVNDYLAERDSQWMGSIYHALGLSVGTIQHGLDPESRRRAYRCDVTYCTNKEVAFDYLRDRIVLWDRPSEVRLHQERLYGEGSRVNRLTMRGLPYAIVDEADSVLIDEARTPLIISAEGDGVDEQLLYEEALEIAGRLTPGQDFSISATERSLELTEQGKVRIEEIARWKGRMAMGRQQREELVRQALVAQHLFSRDKHYLIKDGKVQIVDEYTGRLMPDRSWERGLHQLIEIKENCQMTRRKETMARISYQRFFRRYLHLAGMTGTAREVAGELWSIYRLRVVTIPTNRPLNRRYLPDRYYPKSDQRWEAVVHRISEMHGKARPVLIGTRSVAASEHLSQRLTQAGLPHRVLNARQDREEAEIIAQAGEPARITVATNMAGRGTDIRLAPGVAEKGGLHVIATERHEARRIDRQLFGRCGRQGDPGTSEAIVSLEDELVTVYSAKLFQWLATAVLNGPDSFIARWIGRVLFHRAQRKAERLHARIRRDLLKMDEQLGDALAFSGRPE
ncbi:MAG: preprotein translocase subunit SecA [Thermodesulfobacteriota bacterium]